jgi:hypothetical protein
MPVAPQASSVPILPKFNAANWKVHGKDGVNMQIDKDNNNDKLRGGCQCGNLRYSIAGKLGAASICHCRMCQKAFGSWGAALVDVPFENFTWTRGTPGHFRSSSIVTRGFCKDCGTPMFMREDGDENIEIAIGTLDNPSAISPMTKQSAVESRVAWFNAMHELPEERMQDYRKPEDLEKLKSFQHPDFDV